MNTKWPGFLRKLGISLLFLCAYSGAIPLPGQGIAQSKGATGGMGVGSLIYSECKTLYTWTGHGSYTYKSFLSSGLGLKFLGGNIDSKNNLVNQRYSVFAKFMRNKPEYALFIGPIFSFENTDLSALRKEFSQIGEENTEVNTETKCSDLYASIGSSIGYQSGGGFLLTPSWGIGFGQNLDLTLKGTLIFSYSGLVAFNLREQFEKLKENTENFWLSLEYLASMSRNNTVAHNVILGLSVGF